MKKVSLLIALFFSTINGASQDFSFSLPQPEAPPLPESAVFRQFAGYTPSLSTGTVNVPIPLYTIQMKNFTLPISMQYYTTGIKVDAPADPVGYGWILSPGLRITRTVRGRPDDWTYTKTAYAPGSAGLWNNEYDFYYGRNAHPATPQSRSAADQAFSLLLIDTEYDIFTVHLPNKNASFIYQKDADAIMSSNPLLKIKTIKASVGLLVGFEVVDEWGVTYCFGCKKGEAYSDQPFLERSTYAPNGIFSGWGLREIQLPNSEHTIRISWMKVKTKPFNSYPFSNYSWFVDRKEYITDLNETPIVYKNTNFTEPDTYDAIRMKQINFPGGHLDFIYESYKHRSILTEFSILNNWGKSIKRVTFEYEKEGNTLLLNRLNLSDEGSYRFSYNSNRFNHYLGQDYWGYYNGKPNDELVPNFVVTMRLPVTSRNELISNASREADQESAKANILERVDYPTGGYTLFEYELHQFEEVKPKYPKNKQALKEGRGLRVSKVTTKDGLTGTVQEKKYNYKSPVIDCNNTMDAFFKEYNVTYKIRQENGMLTDENYIGRRLEIHATSVLSNQFMSNSPIFYTEVEEVVTSDDRGIDRLPAYKTAYEFKQYRSDLLTFDSTVRVLNNYIFDDGNHMLTKKTLYKKEGLNYIPVEEANYTYEYFDRDFLDTRIDFYLIYSESTGPHFMTLKEFNEQVTTSYSAKFYTIWNTYSYFSKYFKTKEVKTLYTSSGEITSQIAYTPNNGFPWLIAGKEYDSGNGNRIKEEYTYLTNANRNLVYSYPILEKRSVNNQMMSKETVYLSGNFYPSSILLTKNNSLSAGKIDYEGYDVFANPRSIVLNGIKTTCLWSYNGLYLIAEIKNADTSSINAAIINAFSVPNIDELARKADITPAQLNAFREHPALKGALITTYTYIPLVGIASSTDPSGRSTLYEYDNSNRLFQVRDHQGNVTKKYIYNQVQSL